MRTNLLQFVVGGDHHHTGGDHRHDHDDGDHAEQQDGEGVVIVVDNVFHGGEVEGGFHLDCAEGAEFHQALDTRGSQEIKSQPLYKGDQQRFHQLAVADIAQTPDHKGQFGEDIAFYKSLPKGAEKAFLTAVQSHSSFCHREILLSYGSGASTRPGKGVRG